MSDTPTLSIGYTVTGPAVPLTTPHTSVVHDFKTDPAVPPEVTPAGFMPSSGILNDSQIAHRCKTANLLDPFVDHQVSQIDGQPVISYGLSSAGYDIRLGSNFKVANNLPGNTLQVLDPKQRDQSSFFDYMSHKPVIIPPHGFILGQSVEYFTMPRDLLGLAVNKSTYARCATVTLTTPAEPGWSGILTLEIANFTSLPIVIYPGEGITQIIFLQLLPCAVSYADKAGKYQNQTGVTEARV